MNNLLINAAIDQNHRLDLLLEKTKQSIAKLNSLKNDGDRVWYSIVRKFEFDEKDLRVQDLNFAVPGDCDFVAQRINFALRMNRNQAVTNIPDVNAAGLWKPSWFNFDNFTGSLNEKTVTSGLKVDFNFELTESFVRDGKPQVRKYQNQPIPGILAFAHNNPVFGSPSCMHFDIDWPLIKNSVLQCKVSITSAINEIDSTQNYDKYQFIGVLEGFKRVRAIK